MLVEKRIFYAANEPFVTMSLMMYGKKLHKIHNSILLRSVDEESAEKSLEYKFFQKEFVHSQ